MTVARLQLVGCLLLVGLVAGSLVLTAGVSPEFAFLRQDSEARWIGSPDPISTGVVAAPAHRLHVVEFSRRFELAGSDARVQVRLEALRGFELDLNGRRLAARGWDEGNWREPVTLEATEARVDGENELVIRVRNPTGPPLLRASVRSPGLELATDPSWQTRRDGGPPRPGRPADDTLRAASTLNTPRPLDSLRQNRDTVLLAFVVGCLLSLALGTQTAPTLRGPITGAVWVAIGLLWLAVFLGKSIRLPAYVGFDGPDHFAYVQHVLAHRSLPVASDGPQMHHPPLFYLLSAGLVSLVGTLAPERVVLRLLPFASGLTQVAVAWGLARRLVPGDPTRAMVAAAAAACLPVNLYMSAYLSNESLHAALAALSLLLTVELLLAEDAPWARLVAVGGLLGLAILTKVSALLLVPVVAAFVLAKLLLADRRRPVPALLRVAGLVASTLALCGWYFVRNQLRLGRAFVGNWDVPGSPIAWWQHPGFHTPGYYLSFGDSLQRPFFASFDSFWDGLYSTFWGDGLVAGVASWAARHPLWDYGLATTTYALALPATGLLLLGFACLVGQALRDRSLRRRAALSFLTTAVFLTVVAALFVTLRVPAYSMTKASYLLSVVAPLAVCGGEGFVRVRRLLDRPGRRFGRVLLDGWAAALVIGIALSFAA